MIIRRLTLKDIFEHNKTSSSSFIWGITPDDNVLPARLMYGAFTDSGVGMSQLECADFSVYFGKGTLGCAGIGGVATRPEYRGEGCVKLLFEKMAEEASDNNFDISILYPFSTSFYRKLGYANLGYKNSLKTELSNFSGIKKSNSVVLYEKNNSEMLYRLYNDFAKHTDLMFIRNDDRYFFNQPYIDNKYTYIWTENGNFRAYASFEVNRATSTLEVSELGYLDSAALCGIIGFLRNYESVVEHILFHKLPIDSPVLSLLKNTSHIERKLSDLGSARIHNIVKVLENRVYPSGHGAFSFFADDIFESNRGIYDVVFENGNASVKRRDNGEFDFSLDTCAMAKLFLCGTAKNFYQLSFFPGVRVLKENADFLKAFSVNSVFFMNGF